MIPFTYRSKLDPIVADLKKLLTILEIGTPIKHSPGITRAGGSKHT